MKNKNFSIKKGDVVSLKSGGPKFTVASMTLDGKAELLGYDSMKGAVVGILVPVDALKIYVENEKRDHRDFVTKP